MGLQKPSATGPKRLGKKSWEETRGQGVPVPHYSRLRNLQQPNYKSRKLLLTMVRVDVEQGLFVMVIAPRISVSPRLYRMSRYGTEYRGTKGFSLMKKTRLKVGYPQNRDTSDWGQFLPLDITNSSVNQVMKQWGRWTSRNTRTREPKKGEWGENEDDNQSQKMRIGNISGEESFQSALFQGQSIRRSSCAATK